MSPEREAQIRQYLGELREVVREDFEALFIPENMLADVLAELDCVRAERNDMCRCRSTWQGRRCRDENGHQGIHVADDESDWIDGDGSAPMLLTSNHAASHHGAENA